MIAVKLDLIVFHGDITIAHLRSWHIFRCGWGFMEEGVAAAAASGKEYPVAPQPRSAVDGGIRGQPSSTSTRC